MPRIRLVGVLINIGRSLLSLERKADRIMSQLDDLKAADAAEASAVSTALASILALQAQHQEDLVKLATHADDNDDDALAALTKSMQDRSKSITDALSTLQDKVAPAPAPTADPAPAAGVTGAAEPVPEAPAAGATGA